MGGTPVKRQKALEALIEQGILALPNTTVIRSAAATKATYKAKKPELRSCEGDNTCLSQLGALTQANVVVYAEVSDLGEAQVLYLKAVDVATRKELRSTTFNLGTRSNRKRESKAAAMQLLAPNQYVGRLEVKTPVPGATVFLDGHKVAVTPSAPIAVYVGSHALRVTHPEHSDYVRFVDIKFEQDTVVNAELLALPGVNRKLSAEGVLGDGTNGDNIIVHHRERPWYYRWYTITGGVAAIAITTAVISSGGSAISPDLVRDL